KTTTGVLQFNEFNDAAKKVIFDGARITINTDKDKYVKGTSEGERVTNFMARFLQEPKEWDPVVWATNRADKVWKKVEGDPSTGISSDTKIVTREGNLNYQEYID